MLHDRYSSDAMRRVWSDESRYRRWREVELAVLTARAELGEISGSVVEAAADIPAPTPAQVTEVEATTRHDLVAFVDAWTATMPREASVWVHRGLTSSDVVDTALAVALRDASDLLLDAIERLVVVLKEHALKHSMTVRLGRTHGQAAVPDVWGHRVADFAFAVARCRDRLQRTRQAVAVAKVSGPVGTYAGLDPRIETLLAAQLELTPVPVATQVVMRDSLADWMSSLAVIASVCEAVALEVRHGQRFEVGELGEPSTADQSGSSVMPHKRNPIMSERICGLARVVRSLSLPVMEGIPLWHERDLSHSSVERLCLPEAAALTEHILVVTTNIVAGLYVDIRRMRENLEKAGSLAASDLFLQLLLDGGICREQAYDLVRRAAGRSQGSGEFEANLRSSAAEMGVTIPNDSWLQCAVDRVLASPGLASIFDRLRSLR